MKLVFLYLSRRPNQYYKRKVVKRIVPNHNTTWLKSCSFPLDCCRLYCFTEKSAQPIMEHIFLFFYSSLKTSSTLLFILSWTAISSVTIFFSSGNGLYLRCSIFSGMIGTVFKPVLLLNSVRTSISLLRIYRVNENEPLVMITMILNWCIVTLERCNQSSFNCLFLKKMLTS